MLGETSKTDSGIIYIYIYIYIYIPCALLGANAAERKIWHLSTQQYFDLKLFLFFILSKNEFHFFISKNHKNIVKNSFEGIGDYEKLTRIFHMKQSARNFFSRFFEFLPFSKFFLGKLKIFKPQSQLCEMKKCGLICADMIFYIHTKYK